jgi:hypothetical protein
MVAIVVAALVDPTYVGAGLFALVVSLVGAHALWRHRYLPWRTRGELAADGEGLRLDGRLVARSAALARAVVQCDHPRGTVVKLLDGEGRPILDIEVPDATTGEALACALRLDRCQTVTQYRLPHHMLGQWWVFVLLSFVPIVVGVPYVAAVAAILRGVGVPAGSISSLIISYAALGLLAVGGWCAYRASRIRLLIGSDGIVVRRFGRSRFVPAAQIASVQPWPRTKTRHGTAASEGIDIVLVGGGRIRLRTIGQRTAMRSWARDVIADDIRELVGARPPTGPKPELPTPRSSDTVADWLAGLRNTGREAGQQYRASAIDFEALRRTLQDPLQPPLARLSSAVVLLSAHEGERDTIVEVAKAVASPALRRALLALGRDDDRAVHHAARELTEV